MGTSAAGEFHRHYSWDVYHIENYLLESNFICEALKQIGIYREEVDTPEMVESCLREIAKMQIGQLVSHKIRALINKELIEELELGVNPNSEDIGEEMHRAITKSLDRIQDRVSTMLGIADIRERVNRERVILEDSLCGDDWKKFFKGRDVLSTFAGKYANGMRYEYFRDFIISLMANAGYQPEGMKSVLYSIASD